MRILLLSAYDADSHRYWRENLLRHLECFEWRCLTLPPRHFSWRIRGNPVSWVSSCGEQLSEPYDLLLATSMVDVATIKGLIPSLASTPTLVTVMLWAHVSTSVVFVAGYSLHLVIGWRISRVSSMETSTLPRQAGLST